MELSLNASCFGNYSPTRVMGRSTILAQRSNRVLSDRPSTEAVAYHSTDNLPTSPTDLAPTAEKHSSNNKANMIVHTNTTLDQAAVSAGTVEAFVLMARKYSDRNRFEAALDCYSRALRIQNKMAKSQAERLFLADLLFEIGTVHFQLRDAEKALAAYDLCRSIRHELLEWDDERNVLVLLEEARLFNVIGDSESGVRVLEELIGMLCCAKNHDDGLLRECWMELARHQEKLGLSGEAQSSRQEAGKL